MTNATRVRREPTALPMLRDLPAPQVARTPAREALRECFARARAAEDAVDEFRKSLVYFSSLLTQLEKGQGNG